MIIDKFVTSDGKTVEKEIRGDRAYLLVDGIEYCPIDEERFSAWKSKEQAQAAQAEQAAIDRSERLVNELAPADPTEAYQEIMTATTYDPEFAKIQSELRERYKNDPETYRVLDTNPRAFIAAYKEAQRSHEAAADAAAAREERIEAAKERLRESAEANSGRNLEDAAALLLELEAKAKE